MPKKIILKKNQGAMFHAHTLSENEISFLIRNFPISEFNKLLEVFAGSCYDELLDSLVKKIDIFNKNEV